MARVQTALGKNVRSGNPERGAIVSDILAYADRQAVKAGERIEFKISLIGAEAYRASVVRLLAPSIGSGPHFPAKREEEIPSAVSGNHRGARQAIQMGSWIKLDKSPALSPSFTLCAFISPTLLGKDGAQIILGNFRDGRGASLAVAGQALVALVGSEGGARTGRGRKLAKLRWHFVALS